ncbi:P-loop containing nucleoside triphosphate hydrolase [Syntrophomonas zehnderi OL-4]|uniref:p-loop containing nucleoside triphosphate hydrolase n=1 Tax=Syntrophomonas zehnderi OL-4 TaxID=690567 RepID=A0A0E4GBM6_9FIRM|nr:hypothetical protein [Syntrophomonas zehnderi]CFX93705.1 P-loop containing nucleoside triphosphate hydrolase [Syntrophomonas zehnderi OL-4]
MANVIIFAGGFGSGKSELVLNYAIRKREQSDRVVLADLDLVNPYFVSRDIRKTLENMDIRVVAPSGELSFGDVPNIPAEIIGLLRQENDMIIDLAGDEVGTLVLGYLSRYIKDRYYEFYMVINPYRPFAQDLESVTELKQLLEGAAHIPFTGIVSNPNLLGETTPEIIRAGHEKVRGYAQEMNLPIRLLTVESKFHDALVNQYGEILLGINLYLKPDWM